MWGILRSAACLARDILRSRAELILENAFLRAQLSLHQRRHPRVRTAGGEGLALTLFTSVVRTWQETLRVVKPATLIAWHRSGFAAYWAWKTGVRKQRRTSGDVLAIIQRLARENPLWGSERIVGELAKLGVTVSRSTVQRILRDLGPRPRSHGEQRWSTFVRNHLNQTWACDFFTVPTWSFKQIYVFFVMALGTREVVHFGVTDRPTQARTAQQLREATLFSQGPRFLVRDRDSRFGPSFDAVAEACGTEILTTPLRCPQANAFAERLVGSIRRECLDHLIVANERSLPRVVREYVDYYNTSRPHQGLSQSIPAEARSPPARSLRSSARAARLGWAPPRLLASHRGRLARDNSPLCSRPATSLAPALFLLLAHCFRAQSSIQLARVSVGDPSPKLGSTMTRFMTRSMTHGCLHDPSHFNTRPFHPDALAAQDRRISITVGDLSMM